MLEWGAVSTGPGDLLRLPQSQEEVELLDEELVVVGEVVAEERERLDERPSPGHDLGASAGEQVESGELLEDTNRVVRAEDADGARQPNLARSLCDSGEDDRRCGHGEVGPVVLADPEDVEADLVGERRLRDQVAETPARRHRPTRGRVRRELCEGIEAEFHE